MTFCIPEAAQNNGLAWISVKVKPAGPIDSVAIYLYQPWDNTYKLSPYEVWAGRKFGGEEAQCTLPKNPEPTHGGRPAVAECHGVMHEYITLKQIGFSRRLFINEIAVYTPAPPSPPPLLLTPRRRGEVASIISKRFDAGQPSNDLMRAGVLVHVFDGYEDEAQPWQICHETCRHGAVDTFSSSLISRKVPWLFLSSWGATGLIMSPETQILCSFPADSGTGGHPNGRCFDGDRASVGTEGFYGGGGAYKGNSLKDALAQQYDGSYRRSHFGASGYNEIIVGSMFWEQHLPWVVEAFFFAGGNELRAQMLPAHRNFLSFYGLTAEEVPLLRYVCYVPQLDPVHMPLGEDCFVDVS